MTQLELGMELKEQGKQMAARHHSVALDTARSIARDVARKSGTVTADDVFHWMDYYQLRPLGNAAGSVFDGPEWESVGYKASTRPSRHGGLLRVWRLK